MKFIECSKYLQQSYSIFKSLFSYLNYDTFHGIKHCSNIRTLVNLIKQRGKKLLFFLRNNLKFNKEALLLCLHYIISNHFPRRLYF